MGGVESIPTDPSRRIQVISAGYSRTGTVSMSLALAKLVDGPVLHGGTQILTREDGERAPINAETPLQVLAGQERNPDIPQTTVRPGSMRTRLEMPATRRKP